MHLSCTLREDLLQEIAALAAEQKFDYLLIESSGISEPLPVAETFTFKDDAGTTLSDLAVLDTLVTVVDGASFLNNLKTLESLQSRGWHAAPEDERTISHLLCDQVEFANVIVLNKCDLIDEAEKCTVRALLKKFNPDAEIVEATRGVVDPSKILGTNKFTFESAAKHDQWLKERIGEHLPETIEYGIHSFTFRGIRPMHPERLQRAFDAMSRCELHFDTLLRAKGFVWIDPLRHSRCVCAAGKRQVLARARISWWAAIPEDQWPEGLSDAIAPLWHVPYGDRQQEVVFIGQEMDIPAIKAALNECMLTDTEFGLGERSWRSFTDPFFSSWFGVGGRCCPTWHNSITSDALTNYISLNTTRFLC